MTSSSEIGGRTARALVTLQRHVERAARWRSRSRSHARMVAGSIAALVLFGTTFGLAFAHLPPREGPLRWSFLAVATAIVPLTLVVNGAEYKLAARLVGYEVGLPTAVRVGLIASVANLLPIPGAAAVRAHAIHALGGNVRKIVAATAFIGLGFIGTAAAFTGIVILVGGEALLGTAMLAAGLALQGASFALAIGGRHGRAALALVGSLLLVESCSVLSKVARSYLILRALGVEPSLLQATALATAAIVAVAIGFFPAGLGLSEVISGAISPLIDLPVTVGVLTSGIDKLLGIFVLAVCGAALLIAVRRRKPVIARETMDRPSEG
jgi:hypothetical protein